MRAAPAAIYLDASAILRLLFATAGSKAPLSRFVSTSSRLVEVELFRALDRSRLAGQLDELEAARKHRELSTLFGRLHLFPVGDEVIDAARAPLALPVSSLHALHAATARQVLAESGSLHFWTHDRSQAAAAVTLGLEVRGVDAEV